MTEAEWDVSTDPWSMLRILRETKPSERKVRLFNAAVCRRYWDHLPALSQAILVESEQVADGLIPISSDKWDLCHRANSAVASFDQLYPTKQYPNREIRIQREAAAAVCYAVIPDLGGALSHFLEINPDEKEAHSRIVRDIFGNPFHAASLDPSWLTSTVIALARQMYDSRDFSAMPILADALQDAGCDNTDILDHCRGPGPHVRGCWLVDKLLAKE